MIDTYDQFLKLVRSRHTCRGFKPDALPDGAVEKILEAARWAMSGVNSQPWEFVVVRDPGDLRREMAEAEGSSGTLRLDSTPQWETGESSRARSRSEAGNRSSHWADRRKMPRSTSNR